MKRVVLFIVVVLSIQIFWAQSPQKMSYQAIVRDSNNQLVINQGIGMQISILQGSTNGTAVYMETQATTTNANGLVTIEIGDGTIVSGNLSSIDWANGPYFIKTETDPTALGGTNYTITGTSQLLSVPYAMYAKTAENVSGTLNETDPLYGSSPASNITNNDITKLDHLSGINTGDQDISGIVENRQAIQDTAALIRADMPDVSNFITTETDPIFSAWDKSYNDLTQKPSIIDSVGVVLDTTARFVRQELDPVFLAWDKSYNDLTQKPVIVDTIGAVLDTTSRFIRTEIDGSITNEIQGIANVLTVNNNADQHKLLNVSQAGLGTANPSDCAIMEMKTTTKGFLPPRMTNIDIYSILNPLEGLSVYSLDEHKPYYFNGTKWISYDSNTQLPQPPTLSIGDYYAGGVIFYLDATGYHGLVCSISDISTSATWGCYGVEINGADGHNIGDGKQNTIDILAGCSESGTAADLCENLVLNGYDDWFLPSLNSLIEMKNHRNAIKTTAINHGGSDFVNNVNYWSSTESDSNWAWLYDFNSSYGAGYKTNHQYVRAVRSF